MATHVLTDATVWAHGIALHNLASTLAFNTARETQDNTTFGKTARTMKPGLFTVDLSVEGYADAASYGDNLWSLFDSVQIAVVSVAPTSDDGSVAYTTRGLHTELMPFGGNVGEMSGLSIAAAGAKGVRPVRGRILHPETAVTTDGTGTGRQLGAVTATQAVYGALHVIAASGTNPTLDVTVVSDDNSNFTSATTQLTFAQQTSAPAQDWQSKAGAITDDHWRVAYSLGGSSPSFTFVVVVGIASTSL